MGRYLIDLHAGLIAALIADPDLSDAVAGRVVDEPRQDEALPYVRLGDLTPVPDDTDGTRGAVVQCGVEVYSRPVAGRIEAAGICAEIERILHRNPAALSVAGAVVCDVLVQTWTVTRGADGAGYVGTMAFEVHLDL